MGSGSAWHAMLADDIIGETVMLYSLIITLCAINAPDKCEVHEQMLDQLSPSPSMAFVEAQGYLAQWLQQYPDLKLQRWRLEPGHKI